MDKKWISYNVKVAIRSIDPDAEIILFGSKARGDDKSTSDWDFLILTSMSADEKTKSSIREKLIDTELEAEEVISTLIYSKEAWKQYKNTPLYYNIKNEGVEI